LLRFHDATKTARQDDGAGDDDDKRDTAADETDDSRSTFGLFAERLSALQENALGRLGGNDDLVNGAHRLDADIRLHDSPSGVKAGVAAGVDCTFELVELDVDLLLEDQPTALLLRIVNGKGLQLGEAGRNFFDSGLVRFKIRSISRNKEAALTSLGVLQGTFKRLGRCNNFDRVRCNTNRLKG
jgi:hypothetical protein